MRVIIVLMMAMAESSGPAHHSRAIASVMTARGWQVSLCTPGDSTVRVSDGVGAQPVLVPSPLGMPQTIGKKMFPLAQKLGVNRHVPMCCFDDVLRLTGNTNARYLASAVEQLREIIRHGCFDAVYSEFNIAAIIAAEAEGVPVFGTTSLPTQPSFASDPPHQQRCKQSAALTFHRTRALTGGHPAYAVRPLRPVMPRSGAVSCREPCDLHKPVQWDSFKLP